MQIQQNPIQTATSINQHLIQQVVALAREERRIGVEILELLQEIERRKAYAELGYEGLFSFCVKELQYSEAQAYRRIQAMRAMTELPELKQKIETGALTVTTVSQVQTHLRQQKRAGLGSSKNAKLELFRSIENCSAKEVEKKIEIISGNESDLKLVLSLNSEMRQTWEQIKNRTAHSTHGDPAAILKLLMHEWLKRNTPKVAQCAAAKTALETGATSAKKDMLRQKSRYIRSAIKRQVYERDQDQCQNCGSKFAIQIDHREPYAKGGENSLENLRLFCRSCNLHQGIKAYGLVKMKRR